MTTNEALAAIIKGVHADLQAYAALKALLNQQFKFEIAHDAERMAETTAAIEQAVVALNATRKQRMSLFKVLVPAAKGNPSIEPILAMLPPKARESLTKWWGDLEALVKECRYLNSRNGQLMVHQREILRVVLGAEDPTYSPVESRWVPVEDPTCSPS